MSIKGNTSLSSSIATSNVSRRAFVLQEVQPALLGLMDGSVSTLAPIFAAAGQQRRLTLGRVVRGNLKRMRLAASEVLAKARLGQDTVAEQRAVAIKAATRRWVRSCPVTSR